MTMSNLSQISQSPFRAGGTTPSRGGGFNVAPLSTKNQLQQQLGSTESASKLSTYMSQMQAKSQPGLDASNSNIGY